MERAGVRVTGAVGLAVFVVAVVAMMIVPLPRPALDILLVCNMAVSVALLLVALSAGGSAELSSFPMLLVLTTLFRLYLNVSSVRLILLSGDAGQVIRAFGTFVVRGDYVVGFAVFLILTLVQYLVIARGAERVAEVAARFSLDAMPGQQLAIDADLRAGQLDAVEARTRRSALQKEAQLYGALDGAMRFVKGDAIAGILILAISLAGGLIIGVVQRGLPLGEAARLYTLLTIGDGLVSQLPALLVSTAAGLVVTRVASAEGVGSDLVAQLGRPQALYLTAGFLIVLAVVPGLPLVPFLIVGLLALGLGWWSARRRGREETAQVAAPSVPMALELGLHPELLSKLATPLATLIQSTAEAVALDLGLFIPSARLRAVPSLPAGGWQILLRGTPVIEGVLPPGRVLAEVAPAALPEGVSADPASHPATLALASWVPASAGQALMQGGVRVMSSELFLQTAFESVLRRVAPELVGLDETQRLVDQLQAVYPALVREVVGKRIDTVGLSELLRRLLAEGEPIGDLRDLLEAVARIAPTEKDPAMLAERVRGQLQRLLTRRHTQNQKVAALVLDSDAEEVLRGSLRPSADGPRLALEPDLAEGFLLSLRREVEANPGAILLTSGELRRHLRRLVITAEPRLAVLAYHELLPEAEIDRVGSVSL